MKSGYYQTDFGVGGRKLDDLETQVVRMWSGFFWVLVGFFDWL
jgi:hypothetical protein